MSSSQTKFKSELFRTHVYTLGLILINMSSGTRSQPSDGSQNQDHCFCLEELVSGLYSPTGAQFTKIDGDERILIVEQRGTIRSVSTKGHKSEIFMDIRDRVLVTDNMGDSRGLLSAVLSPNFQKDGMVYTYYIKEEGDKQYSYVSQFHAMNGEVDPSTEKYLLRVQQPYQHGNGGPMMFGDDGYLYIAVGDGGAHDDALGFAQDKHYFHGSVLRIDTESQEFTQGESGIAKTYSIPVDNPFVNAPNDSIIRAEIFAFGFRNPWGCSVDSKKIGGDGRIYCADTGTDQFDEINIIENGKNYGWNLREGGTCLHLHGCDSIVNEGKPIFEFQHISHHALVGGYIYRGSNLAWMKGKGFYTFADVVTGETYYLKENKTANSWQVHDWSLCEMEKCSHKARARPLTHPFGFAQDRKGELYLLMMNTMKALSPEGKMYKLEGPLNSSTQLKAPHLIQSISCTVSISLLIMFFRKNK